MGRIAIAVLTAIVLAAAPHTASAVGKITVDPNVPGAKTAEDAPEPDTRVAEKITYQATKKTVLAILTDLTEMTGVTLKAGYNSKDWQVRDRKMNIFAKDTPLAQVMNSIARVMKFTWSTSGEGKDTKYRLFMDRRTLLDAETRRLREEQRYEERQFAKREKMLEEFAKLGDLSPRELAKLKEQNPYMYLAAKSGLASSFSDFFRGVPAAFEALSTGQELTMSAANISPLAQNGLLRTIQNLNKFEFFDRARSLPDDLAENIGQATIQMNRNLERAKTTPMGSFLLGDVRIGYPGGAVHVPFMDPESSLAKFIGKTVFKAQEQGRPIQELFEESEAEIIQLALSEMKKDDSGEPAVEHPDDDPDLLKNVKIDNYGRLFEDILEKLSDASKLAVVSDSFGRMGGMPFKGEEEAQLQDVLDKIAQTYSYNWDKHNSVIEFRDRHWFRKRAAQIPEAWLEQWRKTFKKTGTLDIGDLAQIAMLTQEQYNTNVAADDVLRITRAFVFSNRDVLRAYAALDDNQRAWMFTSDGLDLRTVTPDQWPVVQKALNRKSANLLLDPEARVVLTATREPMGKRFVYHFTATSDAVPNFEARWTLHTPPYHEPPKPRPKEEEKPKGPDKPASEKPTQ